MKKCTVGRERHYQHFAGQHDLVRRHQAISHKPALNVVRSRLYRPSSTACGSIAPGTTATKAESGIQQTKPTPNFATNIF